MPLVDTVLLPLAVGLSLLGVILTGLAWRRGNTGRVIQGVGVALAPVALYLSGLLRLLWNGAVAVGRWAAGIILSPAVWLGLGLIAVCVILWVVGGFIARRRPRTPRKVPASERTASLPAAPAKRQSAPAAPAEDDDMAEIEALLKARGIN